MKEMCEQIKFTFDTSSYESRASLSPSPVGPSCLRSSERKKAGITRNVSFPDDDSQIVTGILEPENPWKSTSDITNDDLVSMYLSSCSKHGTFPIPEVLDQICKFDLKVERNPIFSLKDVILDPGICETLEEILKHLQFQQIDLESTGLDDEASVALFDMLEYYESATHLNISSNYSIGVRGWQACARMIKKTCCLEELEARNTTLNEVSMPILGRALKVGSQLQVLKLENCNLSGRPLIILASALKINTNLKELYLSENNLGMNDASQLGSMLKCNNTLQLLDISHNDIRDVGFNFIIDGIVEQDFGLKVLMVWNNTLGRKVAYTVVRLLEENTSLETLNIGMNNLTDEFLRTIKEPLIMNKNLLRLGLQSTMLTNESAVILADVLKNNDLIQRIDLRDNNIQISGLIALLESLADSSSVIRLDLDKTCRRWNTSESNYTKYQQLVEEIRKRCADIERSIMERKNEVEDCSASEEEDSVHELAAKYYNLRSSVVDTRKISLTCESLQFRPQDVGANNVNNGAGATTNNYLGEPKKNGRLRSPAPSPIPSPVNSPSPVRSRFHVSKVNENQNSCPFYVPSGAAGNRSSSRFKVTVVEAQCGSESSSSSSSNNNSVDAENPASPPSADASAAGDGVAKKTDPPRKKEAEPKKEAKPISEKIRKLSWVSPILQAPAVAMESAKIPANLEKLLGLFQNPFVRSSPAKADTCCEPVAQYERAKSTPDKANDRAAKTNDSGRKWSADLGSKQTPLIGGQEQKTESDASAFPATWPQKISSTYGSSPNKSSPNILEATAFVLLQGHVSSDLARLQDRLAIPANQSENTATASEQT